MTSRPSTRTLRIKKHLREGTLPKHTQSNDTQNTYAMARCPNTHPGYTQKTFPRARCPNTRLNDTQKIITRGALPKYTKKPHAGQSAQIHKKIHAMALCPNKKRLTLGARCPKRIHGDALPKYGIFPHPLLFPEKHTALTSTAIPIARDVNSHFGAMFARGV